MKKIIASLFTAALLGGAANAAAAYAAETTPAGIDNLSLTEQNVSASSEGQLYTTKDVESELRLRAEATTEAEIVGNIPVGALFSVTDISGDWAEAEYGSSKGYVSVKYIRKITEADSGITIKDAASPEWFIPVNAGWDFKGSVSSKLVLKRVWGGVYKRDGKTEVLTASTSPESDQFDTAGFLNKNVDISKVGKGNYTYKLFAEDAAGKVAELVSSDFTKLGDAADYPSENTGDLNKDGKFTSADADMLQRYLIGDQKLNTAQFIASDMDHDMKVNAFDLVLLRQNILASPDAPSVDPTDGWSTDQAGTYTTKNVNTELNIRKSASISDGTVGSIPAGAKFTVSRTSKDWAYAEYNGMKGYVSVAYIQKYTEPEIVWSTADAGIYVKKNLTGDINVRESASTDSNVIGAIPGGAKFRVTKTSKDWVYVDYKDLQGYVPMANVQKYVELEEGWTAITAGTYTTYNVTDGLNFRAAANINSEIIGTIPAGATFNVIKTSKDWAYAEYIGTKGYVSTSYIKMIDPSSDVSVHLDVMEYNQHPSYPTGCESAALYMLLKYYDVNVTMEQIVQALPKGPLPYYSSGTLYGANPETEFVGDPHSSYSYGVFNEPLAKTAAKFKSGVKTKKGSSIDEIIALLKTGKPVVAWYTTTPGKDIYYNDSWYDYKTGKLIRWPAGEHAVVVCGFNIASKTLTYRDPNTGGSRTVSFGTFEGVFKELGSRILYY